MHHHQQQQEQQQQQQQQQEEQQQQQHEQHKVLPLVAAVVLPSAYRFAQRFAPVIPYEVRYMIRDKGISNQQISSDILPVSVYSRVLFIFLAAPACAVFSYHGTLMLASLVVLAEYSFLLWGKSVFALQIMQLFRAMAAGIEVVFPAYLFLLVPPQYFQLLTSCTDASSSISHFGASELGQILMNQGLPISVLLYISMAMVGVSVIVCLVLPKDPQRPCANCPLASETRRPPLLNLLSVCRLKGVLSVIKETWKSPVVQLLSFWWAFDVAGHAMAATYMLNLFEEIDPTSLYNGHVVAATEITNFIGALSAIPLSKLVGRDNGGGIAYYTAGSVLIGTLLISMPYTRTLWVAYPGYVVIVGVNRALLCIVHVQCARYLENKEYVLLFSLNTLAGRFIQSTFQGVIGITGPSIMLQYYVFGFLFLAVAAVLLLVYIWRLSGAKCESAELYQPLTDVQILS